MKKILILSILTMTLNANAMISDGVEKTLKNLGDAGEFSFITTTFSLPTILIADSTIDLNSLEAQERLEAEIRGDIEPVLLEQIAIENHLTIDEIKDQLSEYTHLK